MTFLKSVPDVFVNNIVLFLLLSFLQSMISNIADGEIAELKEENESYGWLEEIEMPENSQMDGIEYLGPQIIETSQ